MPSAESEVTWDTDHDIRVRVNTYPILSNANLHGGKSASWYPPEMSRSPSDIGAASPNPGTSSMDEVETAMLLIRWSWLLANGLVHEKNVLKVVPSMSLSDCR